jgi:hypothetical protein
MNHTGVYGTGSDRHARTKADAVGGDWIRVIERHRPMAADLGRDAGQRVG